MIFPSIDKLLEKVDSKYSLVIAAAKRARAIKKGDNVLVKSPKSKKYVGIALEEIDSTEIIIKSRLV